MLIPFYHIDAWQIFSSLLWIIGASIVLTTLSFHDLLAKKSGIKRKDIIKIDSFRKFAGLGIVMFSLGFVLSFIFIQSKAPVKEVIYIDQNSYDPDKIEKRTIETILLLPSRQLEAFGSYQISENTVILYENGYAETPFLDFQEGFYEFNFEASGSKALDEFSKIWIAFLTIQDNKLSLENPVKETNLSGQMKSYLHKLSIQKDRTGKIRIHFFNDKEDDQGGNRDVWIKNIEIRRLSDKNNNSP